MWCVPAVQIDFTLNGNFSSLRILTTDRGCVERTPREALSRNVLLPPVAALTAMFGVWTREALWFGTLSTSSYDVTLRVKDTEAFLRAQHAL
jgi:hypothetical protein